MKYFCNKKGLNVFLAMSLLVLMSCIAKDDRAMAIQELSKKGIKYNKQNFFSSIEAGNSENVALFLKAGMDFRSKNERGLSPLIFLFSMSPYKGTEKDQEDIAKLLISAGADVNERIPLSNNPSNVPVIVWAIHRKNPKIIRLFIDNGANVNAKDNSDSTPLFSAVFVGDFEICKILIERGADVNAQDGFGQTPLFLVDDVRIAELLILNGADVNAKNDDNISLLSWHLDPTRGCNAKGENCIEVNDAIVSLLKSKGAK